jgi:hypothetical protein
MKYYESIRNTVEIYLRAGVIDIKIARELKITQ